MKTILTILFIGLLTAQAQDKHDNTIIVKNVTFDQVVQILADNNIIAKTKDKEVGAIRTEDIHYRKGTGVMSLLIRIKDSTAFISGELNPQVTLFNQPSGYYPIDFRGWKGSDLAQASQKMKQVAMALKGEISYAKL